MRTLLLVIGLTGCGPPARPVEPVPTPAPPAPRASCAPRSPPTTDELADDPALDGSLGYGRSGFGPGGGGAPRSCGKTVATLELGAPTSRSGAVDPTIHDTLAAHELELRRCYEQTACPRLLPYAMRGCFTIEANGSITAPDADSVSSDIRTCIVGVLRSLHFPPPVRGAPLDVAFPLTFRPRSP